ncbi:ABC transporter permease, partial [Micromonospora provocatoris]
MSDFETVAATENQAARRGVSGEPGTPGRAGRPDR